MIERLGPGQDPEAGCIRDAGAAQKESLLPRQLERAREELGAQEEEKIRLETRLRLLEKAVETVNLGVTITARF